MKRTAKVTCALLALGSAGAQAQVQPNDLLGADNLAFFMGGLSSDLGLPAIDPLYRYTGGGNGMGGTALTSNRQELAPMTRFMNSTECTSPQGVAGVRGCHVLGSEMMTIFGNAYGACDTLAYGQHLAAQDLNFIPGIQGPVSTEFEDWRTVLRILYLGDADPANVDPIATRCNTDLRRTLVSEWGNLFKGGCSSAGCPGGVRHAYRREDSGAADLFASLLGTASYTATTFCNGDDTQDLDPIRRNCGGTGQAGDGDEVCSRRATPEDPSVDDYNLGLVLPVISVPNGFGEGTLADNNCTSTGRGGLFGWVVWTLNDRVRHGTLCPDGSYTYGGLCRWPKLSGTGTANTGFGCLAAKGNRPVGAPSTVDGRVYNQWSRRSDGTVFEYPRLGAPTRANHSYFRIEQNSGCRLGDTGDQLSCLVSKQPCSVGTANWDAAAPAGPLPTLSVIPLGLRNKQASGPFFTTYPYGTTQPDYPLARPWYMCRLDDFSNTGTQPANFVAAQAAIRAALADANPTVIRNRASAAGLYPTPADQPLPFHGCTPP